SQGASAISRIGSVTRPAKFVNCRSSLRRGRRPYTGIYVESIDKLRRSERSRKHTRKARPRAKSCGVCLLVGFEFCRPVSGAYYNAQSDLLRVRQKLIESERHRRSG